MKLSGKETLMLELTLKREIMEERVMIESTKFFRPFGEYKEGIKRIKELKKLLSKIRSYKCIS